MARFQLLSGPERRRRWSEEQKRALVAAFAPGQIASEVRVDLTFAPGRFIAGARSCSDLIAVGSPPWQKSPGRPSETWFGVR